jgi:hypothetical protein
MLNRRDLVKTGGLAVGALTFGGLSAQPAGAQSTPPAVQSIQIPANGFIFEAIACGPQSGEEVAVNTANFVAGPYTFIQLPNVGHFIADQVPQDVVTIFLQQVQAKLT